MKYWSKIAILFPLVLNQFILAKNMGLQWGYNSCYFDSSIQALSQMEQFNSDLDLNDYGTKSIPHSYINLIKKIRGTWTPESQFLKSGDLIDTEKSLRGFHFDIGKKIGPNYKETEQKDSGEFIIYLLNQILNATPEPKQQLLHGLLSIIVRTEITGIGVFDAKQNLIMPCDHKSVRYEPNIVVTLQIDNNDSLADCLNGHSKIEQLTGESKWNCGRCGFVNAKKTTFLCNAPKYLIIALSRFSFDKKTMKPFKISRAIKFSQELIFDHNSTFLSPDLRAELIEAKLKYNLLSFIVHRGAYGGGHYWAYGKEKNNKWWRYDDETITDGNVPRVVSKTKINDSIQTILQTGMDNNATPYIFIYELASENLASPHPTNLSEPQQTEEALLQKKLQALKIPLQALKTNLETLGNKLVTLNTRLK